jgi:hypothetical protein
MSIEIERCTLEAFVTPHRRHRYVALLETKRGRRELRTLLAHSGDFDSRFLRPVPRKTTTVEELFALLQRRGALATCHVMAELDDLDGRTTDLRLALAKSIGGGHGILITCIPGRLAYYQGEEADDRYVLERATAPVNCQYTTPSSE